MQPVANRPISTWARQWLTPTSGTPSAIESERAAVATVRRHGPSPGPCENATATGSRAASSTGAITAFITAAWCWAASRGWIPPVGRAVRIRAYGNQIVVKKGGTEVPRSAFEAEYLTGRRHRWIYALNSV